MNGVSKIKDIIKNVLSTIFHLIRTINSTAHSFTLHLLQYELYICSLQYCEVRVQLDPFSQCLYSKLAPIRSII